MDAIVGALRNGLEAIIAAFYTMGAFWGLTILSALLGVVALWIVGKTTPQKRVERARAGISGAIYEIRLFLDSPKRVFIAQGRMLAASVMYVAYMLPAFVILGLPLWMMYLHIDTRHAMEGIEVGRPVVVAIELADGTDGHAVRALESPGLIADAPPVVDEDRRVAYLRVAATEPGEHTLALQIGETRVEKIVSAGSGHDMVYPERASGWRLWLESYGAEPRLDPDRDGATAIRVPHPERDQTWIGLPIPWWLYSLVVLTVVALGLKSRLGVVL